MSVCVREREPVLGCGALAAKRQPVDVQNASWSQNIPEMLFVEALCHGPLWGGGTALPRLPSWIWVGKGSKREGEMGDGVTEKDREMSGREGNLTSISHL